MRRTLIAAVSLALATAMVPVAQGQEKQTIRFKVTDHGLVTNDVNVQEKRFAVPKGVRLRLVFEYNDRNGNAHQFTMHSTKTDLAGQRMTPDGIKTTTFDLTVGEGGEEFYRISCDLPCVAMEELTDYLLFVDRTNQS